MFDLTQRVFASLQDRFPDCSDDAEIVQYMTEVVKIQQQEEFYRLKGGVFNSRSNYPSELYHPESRKYSNGAASVVEIISRRAFALL